ncbi:ABC transporter permease [Flindersiella endophytica]
MFAFVLRRLIYGLLTLVIISIASFVMVEAPPGNALTAEIQRLRSQGGEVSQDQIKALEVRYGVNDPIYEKYWQWASGFAKGDFGYSFDAKKPVSELIAGRIGYSVMLSLGALLVAWLIAIPVGVYSATHRYSLPDYIITTVQFIGIAIPEFLLALIVLVIASRYFGIDVGGLFSREYQTAPWSFGKLLDLLSHLWIPLLVISAGGTAWLTRVMRANLLDVLNQQYVQTARAKGVIERGVIWKHAVRNAFHPLVMALGGVLPALIGGEAIVSIVLNLPTLGPLFITSLTEQDLYLSATLLLVLSALLIIGNLLADILLAWLDPRVRTVE